MDDQIIQLTSTSNSGTKNTGYMPIFSSRINESVPNVMYKKKLPFCIDIDNHTGKFLEIRIFLYSFLSFFQLIQPSFWDTLMHCALYLRTRNNEAQHLTRSKHSVADGQSVNVDWDGMARPRFLRLGYSLC